MDDKAARDSLRDCLRQQTDELEMLESIFCNPGELKVSDPSIVADVSDFIEGKRDNLSRTLDFTVAVTLDDGQKVDIHFELPHSYPMVEMVDFSIRTKLPPRTEAAIKSRAMQFIERIDKSSVYVYQIITWLQENYCDIVRSVERLEPIQNDENEKGVELERMWIYSHHLISNTKRQNILKLTKQLNLNGFSKPGKPGIICVEGRKEDTQEFWKCVRQWSWQRITVRLTESKTRSPERIDGFYRFDKFKEALNTIHDSNDHDTEGNLPMEMSAFMKFLDDHKCSYVKKELLHLD